MSRVRDPSPAPFPISCLARHSAFSVAYVEAGWRCYNAQGLDQRITVGRRFRTTPPTALFTFPGLRAGPALNMLLLVQGYLPTLEFEACGVKDAGFRRGSGKRRLTPTAPELRGLLFAIQPSCQIRSTGSRLTSQTRSLRRSRRPLSESENSSTAQRFEGSRRSAVSCSEPKLSLPVGSKDWRQASAASHGL